MDAAERGSLSKATVLAGASHEVVAMLEGAARWERYATGEPLFEQGDTSTDFVFLVEGSARVLIRTMSGQEVAFADVGEGGHLGELSLVDGGPRSAAVVAADNCLIARVDRGTMLEVLGGHSVVALNLMQDFARILRGSNNRVVDLSTKSGIQRVYEEMLRLAEPSPNADGSWVIPVVPMHKEIAVWAGTTADTVARAIGQLTSLGVVKRRNRSLHIADRRHIEKLANFGEES